MKLYTLGTSHGSAEPGRSCSGNLLEVNGKYYLFDCGGNVEGKMTDLNLQFMDIRAVFITHMHEDHVVTLPSVVKRFYKKNTTDENLSIYMPEKDGIAAFKQWLSAIHLKEAGERTNFVHVTKGVIYTDEFVTVSAIPTMHMMGGKYPSFAYMVESGDKRFIYTGDLWSTFEDYPEIIYNEDFDGVLCELVHFNVENNLETIIKSRTKRMIFTHLRLSNIPLVENSMEKFPFEVVIAEDGMCYEI